MLCFADAATINAELARIRAEDKEREKTHNKKFKGKWDHYSDLASAHIE